MAKLSQMDNQKTQYKQMREIQIKRTKLERKDSNCKLGTKKKKIQFWINAQKIPS